MLWMQEEYREVYDYMRIIRSCPKFEVQTQNPFFSAKEHHRRHRQHLLVTLSSYVDHPLHFKKSNIPKRNIWRGLLATYKSAFSFSSVFNLNNSTSGFSLFLSSKCYWILMHASLNNFFHLFTCCSARSHKLPIFYLFIFYFFAFWGWSWCHYQMA